MGDINRYMRVWSNLSGRLNLSCRSEAVNTQRTYNLFTSYDTCVYYTPWWLVLARYNPRSYYERIPELKRCIDMIASGYFSPEDPNLFRTIVSTLLDNDRSVSRVFYTRWSMKIIIAQFLTDLNNNLALNIFTFKNTTSCKISAP